MTASGHAALRHDRPVRRPATCTPSVSGSSELADLGYTDIWSAEADGADAFTPLALAVGVGADAAARHGDRAGLHPGAGRASPSSVASLADAAPGRLALGIGTSSNVIVERWNGIPFEEPYQRVRDMVRFLRGALAGEKVTQDVRHVRGPGLPLGVAPRAAAADPRRRAAGGDAAPRRPRGRRRDHQLAVGRRRGDRWRRSCATPRGASDKEIVARIFVAPDRRRRRSSGAGPLRDRRLPERAGVRRVPRVARPGRRLRRHVGRWKAGDRKAALAAIPDEVVDELIVHGQPRGSAASTSSATSTTA